MNLPSRNSSALRSGPQHVGLLLFLAAVLFTVFAALGTWQVQRLSWKRALMAQVDQRAHAKEVAAPTAEQWPQLSTANAEYRRVRVQGTFLPGQDTLVQAVTSLGSGFWVMTPLRLADGSVVLVNRGFVPPGATRAVAPPAADTNQQSTVTGLLRMSQPDGAFLRKNDPLNGRWYSRDVQAIAKTNGWPQVAPYFVDADAAVAPAAEPIATTAAIYPVGGLTVIVFHNNHLAYALTWYTLAAMVAGAAWYFSRPARRQHAHTLGEENGSAADD
nr:SURF1 family protein [uncultured Albidiferax sp.]